MKLLQDELIALMEYKPIAHPNRLANRTSLSRCPFFASWVRFVTMTVMLALFLSELLAFAQTIGVKLSADDVICADSGDAVHGGFIIRVDPKTGEQVVISSGVHLQMPFEPVIDPTGQIIVSDSGRLIRVNPQTGAQTIVADQSRGPLGRPYGIAINRDGNIIVANLEAIVQVDPVSGQVETLLAGDKSFHPLAVAIGDNGHLFVINLSSPRQIIRVNPHSGAQQVVTQAGFLKNPQALAVQGNDLYITDVATADGTFGIGRVIQVDAQRGTQRVVSEGGALVGPVGIATDANGQLIVGDPYTVNPASQDRAAGGYDGGIIRIDPLSGTQSLIARGRGSFVNPRGIAIVSSPEPTHKNP